MKTDNLSACCISPIWWLKGVRYDAALAERSAALGDAAADCAGVWHDLARRPVSLDVSGAGPPGVSAGKFCLTGTGPPDSGGCFQPDCGDSRCGSRSWRDTPCGKRVPFAGGNHCGDGADVSTGRGTGSGGSCDGV